MLVHTAAILDCELGVNKVSQSFRAEIPTQGAVSEDVAGWERLAVDF